jgi:EpsD family peptidyl-prolyl cis-trans isomerase
MTKQAHTGQSFYRTTLLSAAMALPLITAGCNRHNAPSGQTIATVNNGEITTSDLQLEMTSVPPGQRKQAQPLVIKTLVDRKVLAEYAKTQGMDHNPDFILQLRRTTELMLAEKAAQRIAAGARQPISTSEINQYLDEHPDIASNRRVLTLDQLTFPLPNKAVATELKPAKTINDVIAVLQRHNVQFTRAQTQVDTAGLPDDLNSKLDALQPSEPLIILNSPNSTANVIADSKQMPLDGDAAADAARQRIAMKQTNDAIQQRGLALREQAKISYAEGFAPPSASKSKP